MTLVGPDWVPHVYTDEELDRIAARPGHDVTTDEMTALLIRAINKMTPEEKASVRNSLDEKMRLWEEQHGRR